MATLRFLKSGNLKGILKVAILRSLQVATLRRLKSGNFKAS